MNYPTRMLLGFTWVGWLNFLVLQWFFVRLQGTVQETCVFNAGSLDWTGIQPGTGIVQWTTWQLVWPVLPLTGWWSGYWPRSRAQLQLGRRS